MMQRLTLLSAAILMVSIMPACADGPAEPDTAVMPGSAGVSSGGSEGSDGVDGAPGNSGPDSGDVQFEAPPEYACNFDHLVGQKASEIDRKQFGDRPVRSLKPGQMVTMEYLYGRINLQVDDAGVIKAVTCG